MARTHSNDPQECTRNAKLFHALAHCPGRALETLCFHRLLQTAIAPPTSLVFGWEAVLVALAPEYMVFRSWAVFLLFAGFATIPVLLTAIFRRRISRRLVRVWLAALALGLVLIAPKLGRMASPAALSYWLFWCAVWGAISWGLSNWWIRRSETSRRYHRLSAEARHGTQSQENSKRAGGARPGTPED